jgi:hypothetical protein
LTAFENGLPRKIFEPKTEKGTEGRTRLITEVNRDFYLWPNTQVMKSRRANLSERVARVVKKRNTCRILVRKCEGIRTV